MPDETPSTPATPIAPLAGLPPAHPATPPAGPPAQTVTIPLEQLTTFHATTERLAALEAEQRARDAAASAEQVRLLAQRGEVENAMRIQQEQAAAALNTERTQRAAIEERAKRYALDGELSRVLASQPLVPGGAEQLTQLWRSQLVVEPHGDSYQVRTPTFQNVNDFVASQLAQPHYAHFLRSTNQGGTAGSTGAHQADPTPPAQITTPQPKTLGEAVILHMQSLDKSRSGDSRIDLSQPMGLRRTAAAK